MEDFLFSFFLAILVIGVVSIIFGSFQRTPIDPVKLNCWQTYSHMTTEKVPAHCLHYFLESK